MLKLGSTVLIWQIIKRAQKNWEKKRLKGRPKRLNGLYMLRFDKDNKEVNMQNIDPGTEQNKGIT